MRPAQKHPPVSLADASTSFCWARPARRRRRRQGETNLGASYSRYSSHQQNETSIDDQKRVCRQKAEELGIGMNPACEYADSAISGTLARREGLDRLQADAAEGKFNVLFFFNLSRLARESVITMPMLKGLVHNYGVRVISVKEGIDSERTGWETLAWMVSYHHEQFIRDLADNVHKGQVGTVLARYSVGDTRYGFHSIPSPNGEMIRRGGELKPRRVYAIHPEQAPWVIQIFTWFVKEHRSLSWIVRELNRQKAPRDRRATREKWHRQVVVGILRSPKYIGIWPWGRLKNERDPLTGHVYQEERDPDEYEPWTRQFPDLRLIDDQTHAVAQQRLDAQNERYGKYRREKGHLHGSDGLGGQTHLLKRIFRCAECQSVLFAGGSGGQYFFCPGHRDGICSSKSFLPRPLAKKLILQAVSDRLIRNEAWVQATYDFTVAHWQTLQAEHPGELQQAQKDLELVERKVSRLVDEIEDAEKPDPDLKSRLQQRRLERDQLRLRVRDLEAKLSAVPSEPTLEWVQERLQHLDEVLQSDTPAAHYVLRDLLADQIEVELVSVPGRKRPIWRGTLQFNLPQVHRLLAENPRQASQSEVTDAATETVMIEFRQPSELDAQVAAVWPLFQQGHSLSEISVQLRIHRSRLTVVMQQLVLRYGNGRTDREMQKEYRQLRKAPPVFEQYIEPAMALYQEGQLVGAIAKALKTHHDMITKAIAAWHTTRGLPVPDGRSRRFKLENPGRSCWETRRKQAVSTDQP